MPWISRREFNQLTGRSELLPPNHRPLPPARSDVRIRQAEIRNISQETVRSIISTLFGA
ncbi:MAG TPA: hypothetical protein VM223_05510 [Planctomycetota bacterium]|nr:hypothetical protein [Planctomycetota bacterium]